jgi:hypothetical protein
MIAAAMGVYRSLQTPISSPAAAAPAGGRAGGAGGVGQGGVGQGGASSFSDRTDAQVAS